MARVKYGALVTSIHGKLNSMVFQNNNFGNTVKMIPIKPPKPPALYNNSLSTSQAVARASQRWYNLTQDQRNAWNAYALAYPQYAKYNNTTSLPGYYVFMKRNIIAESYDSFRLDEPELLPTNNPTYNPSLTSTVGSLLLTFNPTGNTIDIDSWIFASNWAKGDNKIRRGQTKFIQGFGWSSGEVDIYSNFIKVFGSVPAVGNSIYIEIQNIGDLTGAVFTRQAYLIHIT
jgi:hypothetical protein